MAKASEGTQRAAEARIPVRNLFIVEVRESVCDCHDGDGNDERNDACRDGDENGDHRGNDYADDWSGVDEYGFHVVKSIHNLH